MVEKGYAEHLEEMMPQNMPELNDEDDFDMDDDFDDEDEDLEDEDEEGNIDV